MQIFAFSSSRSGNSEFLEPVLPVIKGKLKERTKVAFIPFASVEKSYHFYFSKVKKALESLHVNLILALPSNCNEVIDESDTIMVGGGNTFKLLYDLYELNLLDKIVAKVRSGISYIGWSAGSNILCPTIGTTNDMPVIEPKSFKSLNLFPFQINPHYLNNKINGFNGETRDQRLLEFLQVNPDIPVIGLPEGSFLQLENNNLLYKGPMQCVLFEYSNSQLNNIGRNIENGTDLSFLLLKGQVKM